VGLFFLLSLCIATPGARPASARNGATTPPHYCNWSLEKARLCASFGTKGAAVCKRRKGRPLLLFCGKIQAIRGQPGAAARDAASRQQLSSSRGRHSRQQPHGQSRAATTRPVGSHTTSQQQPRPVSSSHGQLAAAIQPVGSSHGQSAATRNYNYNLQLRRRAGGSPTCFALLSPQQ
jgi:hypothetical protein